MGLDDSALADPRAHVAKRAEERKAADARTRTIREAALVAIARDQRVPKGDLEEILSKLVADPSIGPDGKEGLGAALHKLAPRRAGPVPPPSTPMDWRDSIRFKPAVKDFAELQSQGPEAVARFAASNPDQYAALRADYERRLARPERR